MTGLPEEYSEAVRESVERFQKEENALCIYAGVIGSIAKGIETKFSDVDILVLFVRKDYPGKTRVYGENNNSKTVPVSFEHMDSIRFWEFSSSIDLLSKNLAGSSANERAFDNYIDMYTLLMTPMKWDPHHLSPLFRSLTNDRVTRNDLLASFHNRLTRYAKCGKLPFKKYLNLIYVTAFLEMMNQSDSPYDIRMPLIASRIRQGESLLKKCAGIIESVNRIESTDEYQTSCCDIMSDPFVHECVLSALSSAAERIGNGSSDQSGESVFDDSASFHEHISGMIA